MNKINKYSFKDWLNNILKIAASILMIIGALLGFRVFISDEVNRISNDDEYLKDLASKINPYLIFDINESYLVDGGALKYIEDIEVINKVHPWLDSTTQSPAKIILITNRVFPFEPQISCLNGDDEGLIKTKRGKT